MVLKLNIKHTGICFLLMTTLFLNSCVDDDMPFITPTENLKSATVNLKLNVKAGSTRGAESETAVGVVPQVSDFVVLSLGEDSVIKRAMSAGIEITTIPQPITITSDIRYLHVIGNIAQNKLLLKGTEFTGSAEALSTQFNTAAPNTYKLSDICYQIAQQGRKTASDTQQDKLSHSEAVNVRGGVDLRDFVIHRVDSVRDSNGVATGGLVRDSAAWLADGTIIKITATPAISRIEIGCLRAIKSSASATNWIKNFTVENIFIDNSFKYISADYTTYPAPDAWEFPLVKNGTNWYHDALIAYNWNADTDVHYTSSSKAPLFKASRTEDTKYPADFCARLREPISESDTSYAFPSAKNGLYWSFYVASAMKPHPDYGKTAKDTIPYIGNAIWPFWGDASATTVERVYYRATPIIVIKLSNFVNGNTANATWVPEYFNKVDRLGWLTVNNFLNSDSIAKYPNPADREKARIHRFLPGRVYQIKELQFSDEDVHSQPITVNEGGLFAVVKVRDWTEVKIDNPKPMPM